ncbi:MAG: hypothetical protein OXR68_00115 [Alphaproteobacteria bacterium]|nr:hypothetical protein [Alphaproteobacteria bacterium]MDD9919015.1 hypothetical protein [Alphaproteobacteria bacterium]
MSDNFSHKAIYGATKTGKTWLSKRIASRLRQRKQKVIVYSAVGDIHWPEGCQFFFKIDELEEALSNPANFGAHVFLDEAFVLYKRVTEKEHPILYYMGNMGRHKGYTMYVITQRPQKIPTHIRENCFEVYCFALGGKTGRMLVEEDYERDEFTQQLGQPINKAIQQLPRLHCLHLSIPHGFARVENLA